ncbi:MAG: glycosyltransferase family 2 protein [Thermodesulfobacteriota bacterium]
MSPKLVIISPCRDEAQFVELTLKSVVAQTRKPDLWIIVDDGSQDNTAALVQPYAKRYPWIKLLRRQRGGPRELGPGVVAAFNAGLDLLGDYPFDFIAKLDCDLEFPPDCFARILDLFQDPRMGMASGRTFLAVGNKLELESPASYHIPGQAKFYRRQCFLDLGGLQPVYGWDIIDETDARRHGWRTFSDPDNTIIHHRLQGAALGAVYGRVIWGRGAYAIGGHPVFALARGLFRMLERPWVIGGLAFIWGFFSSYFNPRINRITDPDLIRHLRREQLYRLIHFNRLSPGAQCHDAL